MDAVLQFLRSLIFPSKILPLSRDLLAMYQHDCAQDIITFDLHQAEVLVQLQPFFNDVVGGKKGHNGIYIWGSVGRGKTYLMDSFFAALPTPYKKRLHSHAFMAAIHQDLYDKRTLAQPLMAVAKAWSKSFKVLCLDEFDVATIADAMLMKRLFEALHKYGVVVVTTSNTAPDDLYKNGLQREHFIPFIEMMKSTYSVIAMQGVTDFRRRKTDTLQVFFTPPHTLVLEGLWCQMAGEKIEPIVQLSPTRSMMVGCLTHTACLVDFKDICQKAYGPRDFQTLCSQVDRVFLTNIPKMNPENQNDLLRFIHLIDVLYDTKTILIASSDVRPELLYPMSSGPTKFLRAVSRIYEMQSWVK